VTLAAAFRAVCGPGSRSIETPDPEACIVIYEELQRIARAKVRDPERGSDCAATAFQNLLQGGERTLREPVEDGRVRQYLRRMVVHVEIDMFRRERRIVAVDDPTVRLVESAPAADDMLIRSEVTAEIAASRGYFDSVVVPAVAESMRPKYRAGFERAVQQLKEVAEERSNLDDIVVREFGEVSKTTRERLYQQHSRARRYLLDWLEDELPDLDVSPLRKAALKALVAELRSRPASRVP
jgi:DNA-directed RNA polymerase specialized sigma24 family protein